MTKISDDLDANEIWEFLYGELKGAVPEELTDEVLGKLAAHIKSHFSPPPSGEAGERADHLRMLAFRDIFEFRPDTTTGKDAFEQIAIHARSTVIETQKAIAALPTIKEPTDGK
jgi:hypothetical protein